MIIPAIGVVLPLQASLPLKTEAIACWEFDETSGSTLSDSHNDYDWTLSGVTINQTGKIGKCLSFASGNYLQRSEFLTALPVSFSMWVNLTSVARIHFYSGCASDGTFPTGIHIEVGLSTCIVRLRDGYGTAKTFTFSMSLTTGTWNLINFLITDINTVEAYKNNSNLGSPTVSGSISSVYFGTNYSRIVYSGSSGVVKLDQSSAHSRIITANNMSTLYNSGNGLAYTSW